MAQPGRCMIVDDHADMRALVRLILENANEGLGVGCEAASGAEALEYIDTCDPEIVILDEMMPGMSGIEVADRIREARPDQRIVLFSAFLSPRLRERAVAHGVAVCLPKEHFDLLPEAIRIARN